MFFKVEKIIDYNHIQVSPDWKYKGITGNIIKISEIGKESKTNTVERLSNLLINQFIELRSPFLSHPSEPLFARVYIRATDVSRYFPDNKSNKNKQLKIKNQTT